MPIKQTVEITSRDNTTRGFRSVEKNLTRLDRFLSRIQTTLLGFVGLNIATNLVRDIIRVSDVAVELDAKMALVTSTIEDQTKAQQELTRISLQSGSSLEANTVLFTRLARPVRALGFALQDTTKLTQVLAQGLRISGASQQESASVIRQVSQAFQSGVLRGEEFNALMENGGRIAIALADGLGVSVGALRELSKEGELSSRKVITALNQQAEAIDRENARLPLTIGRSIENIRTQFLEFQRQNVDGNRRIADSINFIAQNMDTIFAVAIQGAILAVAALAASTAKLFINRANEFARARNQAVAEARIDSEKMARTQALARIESQAAAQSAQSKLAEVRANQAVLASKQAALTVAIASAEAELRFASSRRIALQTEVLSARTTDQRAAATARLNSVLNAERATTATLSASKKELLVTSTALSKSLTAETAAVTANTIAQAANAKAITASTVANVASTSRFTRFANAIGLATTATGGLSVGIGKAVVRGKPLTGLFSRLLAFIPRLASGLLGLPGLILFVVGSVIGNFVDLEIASEAVQLAINKVGVTIAALVDFVANGFDLTAFDRLAESYDILEQESADAVDALLADREREKNGFRSAEEEKAAIEADRKRQQIENLANLEKAETKRAELLASNLERELELQDQLTTQQNEQLDGAINNIQTQLEIEKAGLQERITNQEDFNLQVEALELEANQKQDAATLENLNSQLERWTKFYADRINATNTGIADVIKLEVGLAEKTKELLLAQQDVISQSIQTLVSERAKYVQNAVTAEQTILDLQRDSARTLADLLDDRVDGLTAVEEATRASIDLQKVEADLAKIRTLDQVKDAQQIQEIQANAAKAVLEIGNAEKTRAKEFKAGSLDELDALGNRNNAAALYEQIINDSIASNKTFAEDQRRRAGEATDAIEKQKQAFESIQTEIQKVDALLAETRTVDVELDTAVAKKQIAQLDKDIKKLSQSVDVTINQRTVENRRIGGLIGDSPIKRAEGGFTNRTNGKIPGFGGGDKIKLLAEKGEFVVRKEAVNALGEDFMRSINAGVVPAEPIRRRFGGRVDDPSEKVERLTNRFISEKERFELRVQRPRPFTNLRNLAREADAVANVKKYGDQLIEASTKLAGKDNRTYSQGSNFLTEISSLIFSSNGDFRGTQSRVDALFKRFDNAVANGKDFTAVETTSNSSNSSSNNPSTETRKVITREVETPSTPEPEKKRSGGGGAAALPFNIRNITGQISKAIQTSVAPALQKVTQQSASVVKESTPVARRNVTAGSGETINVNLAFDGVEANGQFDNNDATRQLLARLRDKGAAIS